jgi:hypothetical protein
MIVKEQAQVLVNPVDGKQEYILPDDPESQMKAAELTANGYVPAQEPADVWVKQDKEISNQPKLTYVRYMDYVFAPNAKRGNRLFWEGDRFYLTLGEMKGKVKEEKFYKDSVSKISEDVANGAGDDVKSRAISERATLRECFNWYGRMPFNSKNEIDFDSVDTIEQEVIAVVDYKSKELLQIKNWDYHRIPNPDSVYLHGEFEETEEYDGRSLVMKLLMTQDYLNQLYNTVMNNAWLAMQKILVLPSSMASDVAPKFFPGARWYESVPGSIRSLEVGDVKSIGLELQQLFINYAERISNVSIYQTGTARQQGGNKTLGEVEATIHEGNIGLDRFIQSAHSIMRTICQWTVDYYYDRMPPGMERRILGDGGEKIFPTEENMGIYEQKGVNPYWAKDDLAGKYDFQWNGTSLNASKDYQLAVNNDLMKQYLPQPMIQQNLLATWEILKRGLIVRGIKDWQTMLPPKEAIVGEMKALQAKAQAQQAQANAPAPSDMAVKKLIQRGMPPQQAIQAVQERIGGVNAGGMAQ